MDALIRIQINRLRYVDVGCSYVSNLLNGNAAQQIWSVGKSVTLTRVRWQSVYMSKVCTPCFMSDHHFVLQKTHPFSIWPVCSSTTFKISIIPQLSAPLVLATRTANFCPVFPLFDIICTLRRLTSGSAKLRMVDA